LKRYHNAPAHLLLDDTPYFITGAIYDKRPLLAGPGLKERFTELLYRGFERYGWRLDDWVVLDNHYHLLGQSRLGTDLPRLMKYLHGQSALWLHEANACALPVWWNYWDYCPRDEADYRVRQNYLHYNPVRHGYVADLHRYPHSSFPDLLERQGREALAARFRAHPGYRSLVIEEDDF